MFESAELGHEVSKAAFDKEEPKLRTELLRLQSELVEKKNFAVVVLINGVPGAGRGETVNLLNEWMDPRHIAVHALDAATDEERARPPVWRFWRLLPPRGKTGIFFGNWYTMPIVRRVVENGPESELALAVEQITRYERMLTNERVLVLKFWFHLSKKGVKKRLERFEKDPAQRWRVTKDDWRNYERYDDFRDVSARVLRETSTANAPWMVVEGTDPRYRSLAVGRAIRDAIQAKLDEAPKKDQKAVRAVRKTPSVDGVDLLTKLDLSQKLDRKTYDKQLDKLTARLAMLTRRKRFAKVPVVAVFEGMDAGGKGGAIRRITHAVDARIYKVNPVAAPTEDERAQPYLWRFWRNIPARGRIGIFDRSWYGRVLVERVEGFCTDFDWQRAYGEINDFEEDLTRFGAVVVKFWLQIDADEQLRRFKERERTGFKKYKITAEDWRNREKWGAYHAAACDMFDRTGTEIAPWHLIPANDKYFARIEILRTFCDAVEKAIDAA